MAEVYIPATAREALKPAFIVRPLKGTVKEVRYVKDAETKRLVPKEVEVPAGYMVKFLKGHTLRIGTKEELKRLGLDNLIPVMTDDGDTVTHIPNTLSQFADDENEDEE